MSHRAVQPAAYAKTTPPRLAGFFPRSRLFDRLDGLLTKKRVWISGPAGSGKTTLVASYLEDRAMPALWYQLDEGDTDLGSFFYYLKNAVAEQNDGQTDALPLLTPEYLGGLTTFSRNFFRALFSRLRVPQILVFDNFQTIPEHHQLLEVFREACNELPEGIDIICLSRNAPPAGLSCLNLYNNFGRLEWSDLLLSRAECDELASLFGHRQLPAATLDRLHSLTQGWLAGFILLLSRTGPARGQEPLIDPEAHQLFFDFFANEIFSELPPATRGFLLKTAFFPTFSAAMAQRLSDEPAAADLLNRLVQENYFTVRHQPAAHYQYHPLFRNFLLAKARQVFSAAELRHLQGDAAVVLLANDNPGEAASLLAGLDEWEQLTGLIMDHAEQLVAEGRYATLQSWIERIPADRAARNPWLLFWRAICHQPYNVAICRALYKQAYQAFKQRGDQAGTLLTWARFVDTYQYCWDDFAPLDYWLDELLPLPAQLQFPDQTTKALVTSSLFTAFMWRAPESPELDHWARQAEKLLHTRMTASHRMRIGNNLLLYNLWWRGNFAAAAIIMDEVRQVVDETPVEPLVQLTWHVMEGAYLAMVNRHGECLAAVHNGLTLAERTGILLTHKGLYIQGIYGSLASGDLEQANDYLARSSEAISDSAFLDLAHYHHLGAWVAICRHDFALAMQHARLSVKNALLCGAAIAPPWAMHTLAQLQIEAGEFGEATANLNRVLANALATKNALLEHHCHLSLAHAALRQGHEEAAVAHLARGLALGRRQGYVAHPWIGWRREVMCELYATALNHDLETEHVQALIRARQLQPLAPFQQLEKWPWLLRIYTLGRFELVVDGQPVPTSRKGQKKPLELLQALIVFGGRQVSTDKLCEVLWPEADGDSAHRSLTTTLHRLRKLIGYDQAIQLAEGCLSLDPRCCWVDAWALERQLEQVAGLGHGLASDAGLLHRLAHDLEHLYDGDFLERTSDQYWLLTMRERLRDRYLHGLSRLGEQLEACGAWQAAVDLYRKGVTVDRLAEPLYQKLMTAFAGQGQHAEALRWYDKCSASLRQELNIPPGPATEKLLAAIRSTAQGPS